MTAPRILVIHSGHPFSTADVFDGLCAGLRANGVEVVEYRLDRTLQMAEALLKAAEKDDVPPHLRPDVFDLAAAGIPGHALFHDVDYAITVTGIYLPWTVPVALKAAGITTALLCTESPYETTERERWTAKPYNVVFTNERKAIPLFTENRQVHYLAHAYNPDTHRPGDPDPDKQTDVCFIGTGFPERRELLEGVRWGDIRATVLGTLWDGTNSMEALSQRLVANADAAAWYRSATINLNHHRTSSFYGTDTHIPAGTAESLGPRAYEIAACGGFQLCDNSRPEARDVFGGTLPTYRSGDSGDVERQVRYWLRHTGRREALATAQREAVQGHTWNARAHQVLDILLNARAVRAQPMTT